MEEGYEDLTTLTNILFCFHFRFAVLDFVHTLGTSFFIELQRHIRIHPQVIEVTRITLEADIHTYEGLLYHCDRSTSVCRAALQTRKQYDMFSSCQSKTLASRRSFRVSPVRTHLVVSALRVAGPSISLSDSTAIIHNSNHDHARTHREARRSSCDETTREKSGIKAKRSQLVSKTKKYKRQALRISFRPSLSTLSRPCGKK